MVLFNTKRDDLRQVLFSFAPSEDRVLYLADNSETLQRELCRAVIREYAGQQAKAAEIRADAEEMAGEADCQTENPSAGCTEPVQNTAGFQDSGRSGADAFQILYAAGGVPCVYYRWNQKNLGYGSAHNIAIRAAMSAGSDYHIVLNPDLRFAPEIIDTLAAYADVHPDVVYMLPRVLYPDGSLQYLCKLLPKPADLIFRRFLPKSAAFVKEENERYELRMSGYDHIFNPPCLSGCFMFMRTDTLREHDLLFDERFFMYCEDFDLMRRLHRVGKTVFFPEVQIIHDHAQSSYKSLKMLMIHIRSAIKYFNKYGWIRDAERDRMNAAVLRELEKDCYAGISAEQRCKNGTQAGNTDKQ